MLGGREGIYLLLTGEGSIVGYCHTADFKAVFVLGMLDGVAFVT